MASLFEDAGYAVPTAAPAASQPSTGALFKDAGFALPQASAPADPAAPAGAAGAVIVPGSGQKVWVDRDGQFLASTAPREQDKSTLHQMHEALDPATAIAAGTRAAWDETKKNAAASMEAIKTAWNDNKSGAPAAGRAVEMGLGALGVLTSPISGLAKGFVDNPVTALTGNPEAGARAGFLASFMLPTKFGGKAAETLSPASRATDVLVKTIGPENVAATVERLRANPNLTLMDVSDPVRTMTQGLIDPSQPKAQTLLSNVAKARIDAAPGAVNDAYTAAMGPAPDTVAIVKAIQKHAEDVGSKDIQPALQKTKPVDVTSVISSIDSAIGADPVGKAALRAIDKGEAPSFPLSDYQRRLLELRGQLSSDFGRGRDQQFLDATGEQGAHAVQSQLRAEAYNLLTSATGSDRNLGGKLMGMRNQIVDAIDDASGGAYKPALAKYRDAKQVEEAFDAGFDTLKNRPGKAGLEDRPEAFREWMKSATPEEIAARQFGTRADIDQKLNGMRNAARQGIDIPAVEYNRQKLEMLFGKNEAGRLVKAMEDQRDMALTNAKLLSGSKTAETLAGREALKVREVGGGNPLQYVAPVAAELIGQGAGLPGVGAGTALALGGLHRGVQYVNSLRDAARNFEFAKAASSVGPTREAAIEGLLSHPKVLSAQKKASNALTAPGVP